MAMERGERIEVGDGSFEVFPALPDGGAGPTAASWRHTLDFLGRTLEG